MTRRLYLFDIDGTLLNTGGAGGKAMRAAFEALWSKREGFANVEFSGRTDYAIFRQASRQAGMAGEDFEENLRRFRRAYYRRLPGSLRINAGRVLPGVIDLLEELSRDSAATLAVGTGNFRAGAGYKLRHYGLTKYFQTGGFGDSTEDRSELIAQGIRTASRRYGRHDTVFVIGDTVHDITAAKDNGAIAIGVLTGSVDEATLSGAGADLVLSDLTGAFGRLSRPD